MSLQITTNINVDFYNQKYIMINAKQYDGSSRWLTITCYNKDKPFNLSAHSHTAYIRYKKADGYSVLNHCNINYRGEVLVELTEQMLAASGICYADLVVVNKGSAIVDIDTGEIVTVDDSAIMSTMAFCVNVYESAIDNSLIESSDEYKGLSYLLVTAEAEYQEVVKLARSYAIGDAENARENEDRDNSKYYSRLSKSYAIGDANDIREDEDIDNAKYYSEQSSNKADASKSYAIGGTGVRDDEDTDNSQYYSKMSKSYAMGGTGLEARAGEDSDNAEYYSRLAKSYAIGDFDGSTETRDDENGNNAKTYMEIAKEHMDTTEGYMNTTSEYMNATSEHMNSAEEYMNSAEEHMNSAKGYMDNAKTSEDNAKTSEDNARTSEDNAKASEDNARTYMGNAKEYSDNAEWYRNAALEHMNNAKMHRDDVVEYVNVASKSAEDALKSEAAAQSSSESAASSASAASMNASEVYTYLQQTEAIVNGLNGAFLPKGTITFAELIELKNSGVITAGYLYQISDENGFTTDENFRVPGKICGAGTSVYYTVDGKFDYFVGAVVAGVKGENETEYKTGMINLTAENVGAISSADIATFDEIKSYFGIE